MLSVMVVVVEMPTVSFIHSKGGKVVNNSNNNAIKKVLVNGYKKGLQRW